MSDNSQNDQTHTGRAPPPSSLNAPAHAQTHALAHPPTHPSAPRPTNAIPLVYEDAEALVIDKPAGLPLSPPRRGGGSLIDHYDQLRLGFARSPTPVHRLDSDTSGCLLMARNPKALKRFAAAFEHRLVTKIYWGIVKGDLEQESGTIDMPLAKISTAEEGWRMVPHEENGGKGGKSARTHWRVLAQNDGLILVEFAPETGRTHQIRVHTASGLGLPLLHDPVYALDRPIGSKPQANPAGKRTMLHAARLVVEREGKPAIDARAALPADFRALGFTDPT